MANPECPSSERYRVVIPNSLRLSSKHAEIVETWRRSNLDVREVGKPRRAQEAYESHRKYASLDQQSEITKAEAALRYRDQIV